MKFQTSLTRGTLVRRYKRFLFDAVLDTGEEITGNCPNTGSMLGLTEPGSTIYMSEHESLTRKYRHQWELIEADGTIVGVNASLPNRIAEHAILEGFIPPLSGYASLKREQKYGRNSRIDILLSNGEGADTYVEVKNVHFNRTPRLAEFPDTKTARGAKHLEELGDMVEAGHRAVMLYVIQRDDCDRLKFCRDLDPAYCAAFDRAIVRGVEAYAINCSLSPQQITPKCLIPVDEPGIENK